MNFGWLTLTILLVFGNVTWGGNREVYERQKIINGVPYPTYFFATWSGYEHPVRPELPLIYAETQNKRVYYEASFNMESDEPLFIFFEKIELVREPFELADRDSVREEGDRYFLISRVNDTVVPGRKIRIEDTLDLNEYIHIEFDLDSKAQRSEIVRKKSFFSYEYKYDSNGLLKQVVVVNREGRNVLEY